MVLCIDKKYETLSIHTFHAMQPGCDLLVSHLFTDGDGDGDSDGDGDGDGHRHRHSHSQVDGDGDADGKNPAP